jgi:hypothetical protein
VIAAFPAAARAGVPPDSVGQIDCNGFSHAQPEIRPTAACADIRAPGNQRFYDNGWYITVAPWFPMSLCDPNSAPETPCTPVSDSNAPTATCS